MKTIAIVRESIGRIVSMLTEKRIKVTQQGASAFVQYHPKTGVIQRVNIPYINDDATEEFIAAVQGFLDHEVGHVLFSDQSVLLEIADESNAIKNLDNLIEDVFIERKMTERFSGSGYNLNKVREYFLTKVTAPAVASALAKGDKKTAQAYAIVAAFRAWGGQVVAQDFIKEPVIAELIASIKEKIPARLIQRLSTVDSSHEVLELTREIAKHLEEKKEPKVEDKPEKPEDGTPPPEKSEEGDDSGDDSADEEKKGSSGEDSTTETDGSGKSRDQELDEKIDPPTAADDKGESSPPTESSGEPGSGAEGEDDQDTDPADGGEPRGDEGEEGEEEEVLEEVSIEEVLDLLKDFDEEISKALSKEATDSITSGDIQYAVFTTEYDKVELAPKARNEKSVTTIEALTKDKIGVMSKALERGVAAKAKKVWSSGQRKGRVSPGALFKTAVGDDRIFRTRFETKAKNTAVSLVVDCSGSMNGDRIKLAAEASYGIASVLDRLKIPFEVIGFTTKDGGEIMDLMREESTLGKWGRPYALYSPVFKGFAAKFDADAKSRIAALTERPGWLHENIDGESIRVAAQRLAKQKVERRIMIVLSDGAPSCPYSRGLSGHLKSVIQSLEKDNIEVVGIGIQTECVKAYYPKSIVINNIKQLPETTMKELTSLLLA